MQSIYANEIIYVYIVKIILDNDLIKYLTQQ